MIHHSDRGSQYASLDYTELLKENGIEISMSRKANPWDNAACESFMKTLKYEEVHRSEYGIWRRRKQVFKGFWSKFTIRSGFTPRSGTCHRWSLRPLLTRRKWRPLRGGLLDEFFQALGNLSLRSSRPLRGYQSDVSRVVRERCTHRPRPHRLDEFPAGYSSAGCSPTWPASASPAINHPALKVSFRSSVFHRTVTSVLTVCLNPGDHRSQ